MRSSEAGCRPTSGGVRDGTPPRRAVLALGLVGGLLLGAGAAGAGDPALAAPAPVLCTRNDHDIDAFLAQIRAERDALARRERAVQEEERSVAALRQETQQKLTELAALRVQVEARIARLETAGDERVAQLAALYGRMPAERAAAVLEALDPDLAARIVGRMRRARGAAVLAALPGPRAAELSRRLVKPPAADASQTPIAQAAARPAQARSPSTASAP